MDISLAEETYEFEVIVTALRLKVADPKEAENRRRYKVVLHRDKPIQPAKLKPVKILTKSPLPDGTIGKEYYVTLAASGGLPPYIWKCDRALPPDMAFNKESGTILGIPSIEVEEMKLSVSVSDARRLKTTDSQDSCVLELSIFPPPKEPPPPPPPPEIVTQRLPYIIEGLPHRKGSISLIRSHVRVGRTKTGASRTTRYCTQSNEAIEEENCHACEKYRCWPEGTDEEPKECWYDWQARPYNSNTEDDRGT